jgi:TIR domain-containing protein
MPTTPGVPPAYQFDVFLSVKNDEVFNGWVRGTFFPLFESYVRNDIAAKCKRQCAGVFYYKKSLKPGDPWPDELREGIRRSRVALALCSPEYFLSKWCLTEFYSFLDRNKKKNAKVLMPLSIHDGDGFPEDARNIQDGDLADYVIVGEGFKETKKYADFQAALKDFSVRVAELVSKAPDFEEWPVIEKTTPGETPTVPQQNLST